MITCDLIVIGLGGVGSAAALHAARSGLKVIGLEQFDFGHNRGSSHGQTRIIRQAYFEHPNYVPLVKRAYTLWDDLEKQTGQTLFLKAGLLEVGPPDGVLISGVLQSAAQHALPVESVDRDEAAKRFPGFAVPESMSAVFEREAGLLFVEKCVLAHLQQAQRLGADCRNYETVVEWQSDGRSINVKTDKDQYSAGSLIISAGAWAVRLLSQLGVPLRVLRKHLHWFQTTADCYGAGQGGPCFFYETEHGYFYGFPAIDQHGLKVAEHSGGELIKDPSRLDRGIDPVDLRRVESFLSDHLPALQGTHHQHDVCMYTMSPDEHFIVDLHPQHNNVAIAAGLSGHGFKFTAALGEALVQMLANRSRPAAVEFLSLNRFA